MHVLSNNNAFVQTVRESVGTRFRKSMHLTLLRKLIATHDIALTRSVTSPEYMSAFWELHSRAQNLFGENLNPSQIMQDVVLSIHLATRGSDTISPNLLSQSDASNQPLTIPDNSGSFHVFDFGGQPTASSSSNPQLPPIIHTSNQTRSYSLSATINSESGVMHAEFTNNSTWFSSAGDVISQIDQPTFANLYLAVYVENIIEASLSWEAASDTPSSSSFTEDTTLEARNDESNNVSPKPSTIWVPSDSQSFSGPSTEEIKTIDITSDTQSVPLTPRKRVIPIIPITTTFSPLPGLAGNKLGERPTKTPRKVLSVTTRCP